MLTVHQFLRVVSWAHARSGLPLSDCVEQCASRLGASGLLVCQAVRRLNASWVALGRGASAGRVVAHAVAATGGPRYGPEDYTGPGDSSWPPGSKTTSHVRGGAGHAHVD